MKLIKSISLTIIALVLSTNANAALIERLGGLAYYDDVADLTWLADANYAMTSGYDADGHMTWDQAITWAAGLNINGVTGWRLPDVVDVGNDGPTVINVYQGVDAGYNILAHSELSNMFYNVLGNTAYYDTSGNLTGCAAPNYCLTNTGPFSNLQSYDYWSVAENALIDSPWYFRIWFFRMHYGAQWNGDAELNDGYSWAVHSGDVSAVPVPAAVWLFGSGLVGLACIARRKKA